MTVAKYAYLNEHANEEDSLLVTSKDVDRSFDDDDDDISDGSAIAWLQIAGSFCIMLSTWGVINSYGVFQMYYQSQIFTDQSQSNIAWIGSLQSGLLLLVCLFIGPLYDAGYTTLLIYAGTTCMVVGMIISSFCSQYWQLLLAQGVAVGVGGGCLYLPGVSIISQYFKRRRGIAFGISALGSSVGGMIFPVVFKQLEPRVGLAWATRAMALIQLAALMVPVIWMRSRTPKKISRRLIDWNVITTNDQPFTLLMMGMFFGYMGIYITYCYIEIYADEVCNMAPGLASYILTITNCGALLGRLVPNYLADHLIGPMNAYISFAAAATVVVSCWIAIKDSAALLAFSILNGFFSGAFVTLGGPIVFALTPDPDVVGTRMGMLTGVCGVALLIGNPLAGAMLDNGSWIALQVWAGSLLLTATGLIAWARVSRYGTEIGVKA